MVPSETTHPILASTTSHITSVDTISRIERYGLIREKSEVNEIRIPVKAVVVE